MQTQITIRDESGNINSDYTEIMGVFWTTSCQQIWQHKLNEQFLEEYCRISLKINKINNYTPTKNLKLYLKTLLPPHTQIPGSNKEVTKKKSTE